MKTLIHLIGWTVAVLALLQLIRVDIPTPPTPKPGDTLQTAPDVLDAIKKGCYDCHSSQTNLPWYSDITPISFEVRAHVRDGRKWLNFEIWNRYDEEKKQKFYKGTVKTLTNGSMPIPMYLWVHKEARLTLDERKAIIDWAKSHIKN
jgi:hypothetical protein